MVKPPREGYHPEWLKIEDQIGFRPRSTGNPAVDIPVYARLTAKLGSQWPKPQGLEIHDERIDLPSGPSMDCRIYRPSEAQRGAKLPLMVFFHGGGYRSGNLDTEDAQCQILAGEVPCIVVSVNYPHTYTPEGIATNTGIDEIIAAAVGSVHWAIENAGRLGADGSRLLVGGGSAGGALSVQVAYDFVSRGDVTTVKGLMLMTPFLLPLDYARRGTKYSHLYRAMEENAVDTPLIDRAGVVAMVATTKMDPNNPRHFPGLGDLSKFPPTYILTAGRDPLRDDGTTLHAMLKDNGVKVRLDNYPGFPHYFHIYATIPTAHVCIRRLVEGVRFVLESGETRSRL